MVGVNALLRNAWQVTLEEVLPVLVQEWILVVQRFRGQTENVVFELGDRLGVREDADHSAGDPRYLRVQYGFRCSPTIAAYPHIAGDVVLSEIGK